MIFNFSLKRNKYTHEEEIHINKRTKLTDPQQTEVSLNSEEQKEEDNVITTTTVHEVLSSKSGPKVNLIGRVSFQGHPTTVNTKGKTLQKQNAVITDETGSIRLVLWQSDIAKLHSRSTYKITQGDFSQLSEQ